MLLGQRRNKRRQKHIEPNKNNNTTYQNLKIAAKGKFVTLQAYLKKQEKSQINNLTFHLKELGKE